MYPLNLPPPEGNPSYAHETLYYVVTAILKIAKLHSE